MKASEQIKDDTCGWGDRGLYGASACKYELHSKGRGYVLCFHVSASYAQYTNSQPYRVDRRDSRPLIGLSVKVEFYIQLIGVSQ
ncbi:hypothetical protein EVAR_82807_1 [Eumeta japonica]|uniref:Uncharacterized protein n=1 Tax=Eumeta variegata TaxID=151549 RepID=A0A4C1UMV1_EUMVA|nr:hypothetical protein EVAR_82807_1 [Eumeta japonica]